MKNTLSIFVVIIVTIIIAIAAYFGFSIGLPGESEIIDESGQEESITGVVYENVMQVPVDGNNFLMVDVEIGRVLVLYQEGGRVPADMAEQQCNNNPLVAESAQRIQAGDTVEIFGVRRTDVYLLDVCSSSDYYINVIQAASDEEEDDMQTTGQVTGTIVDFINDCPVDGICAYVVETEMGERVTVIWSEGDSPNCSNNPFLPGSEGDSLSLLNSQLEASGTVVDDNTISVCGDESYYISFLEDDMSNEESAQVARQVTGEVIELIGDCAFDGNCAYVVQTESGEEVTVIWAEGMSPICQNDPFQGGDTDIQVGDTIDSLGRVIDASTTSACGDTSYYIRKTS